MVGLLTGCGLIEETLVNKPQESKELHESIETNESSVQSSVEPMTPEEEQQVKEKEEHQARLDDLPDVSVSDWNFPLIGYDTKTNILSGVLQKRDMRLF